MKSSNRLAIFVAMCLFSVVSIWTTYVSLKDSILPRPTFPIAYAQGRVHELSVFAFALSLAIGLMLFALKLSIIDGQKRLNFFGLIGLTVVASISIAFNMDVLYRVADHDFFLRFSESRVRTNYEEYLAKVQMTLNEKKGELERQVAKQEGELESEVKGLREKPAGYGTEAKKEEYRLTLLEKTAQVDLQNIEAAITKKAEVDKVLTETSVTKLDDVNKLQDDLRVQIKDLAALAGTPMPQPVKLESPLFAVFQKLSNFRTIGPLEVLVLLLGFLLDLGDIIGYSLVPNTPDKKKKEVWTAVPENLPGPEIIRDPAPVAALAEPVAVGAEALPLQNVDDHLPSLAPRPHPRKRPFRFRR